MFGRVVCATVAIATGLLLASAAAQADEDKKTRTKFLPRGPYIQLAGGITHVNGVSGADGTISGKLGIDIIERIALEAQLEGSRSAERFVLTIQQRSAFLTGRVKPFGVAGIGFARVTRDVGTANERGVTAVALRFGGGVDWWVSDDVALSWDLTYAILTNGLADYTSTTVGVRFRF